MSESKGSLSSLLAGLAMLVSGGYLFLRQVVVSNGFFLGYGYYHAGSMPVTGGMLLLPLLLGIAMVFRSTKSPLGWLLMAGSGLLLVVGILGSLQMHLRPMSLFDLLLLLILIGGGIGLLLRGAR